MIELGVGESSEQLPTLARGIRREIRRQQRDPDRAMFTESTVGLRHRRSAVECHWSFFPSVTRSSQPPGSWIVIDPLGARGKSTRRRLLSRPSPPVSSCGIGTGERRPNPSSRYNWASTSRFSPSAIAASLAAEVSKVGGFAFSVRSHSRRRSSKSSFSGSRSRSATSRMASTSCFPPKRARLQAAPRNVADPAGDASRFRTAHSRRPRRIEKQDEN